MDDLTVTGSLVIPSGELQWRFDPAGGPGGQHANKSSTRVELSYDIAGSPSVDDATRRRLLTALGDRLSNGVLTVQVGDSRSQWRNRQLARRRLAEILQAGLKPPAPRRRPTKPSRAARERRLNAKRARAETKRMRRRPIDPD